MKSKEVSPVAEVVCDVCQKPIKLDSSKLKEKHFPDGIHFSYFTCENCKAKYVTLVTDANLRKSMAFRRPINPLNPAKIRSFELMKLKALELKCKYSERIKELP